jgi:hypothetical protein
MAITVLLVKALNPEGTADTTTVAIATLAYQEQVCCNNQQSCSIVAGCGVLCSFLRIIAAIPAAVGMQQQHMRAVLKPATAR